MLGVVGKVVVSEGERRLGGIVGLNELVSLHVEGLSGFELLHGEVRLAVEGDVFHKLGGNLINGWCKHS